MPQIKERQGGIPECGIYLDVQFSIDGAKKFYRTALFL